MKFSSFLILTTTFLLSSCGGGSESAPAATAAYGRDVWGHRPGPKGFRTVILDAGHGGQDGGAVSSTTKQKEKDLALDTVLRIKAELGSSFKTILMRQGDEFIDLDDRVIRANRYPDAILVSIHYNSSTANIRGPETYYWRVDSHGLAVRCQQAMAQASPAEQGNRGMVRRRLRLTRNPEIPCLLLELGYLSNPAEAQLIQTPAYRQKLAVAIASAIRTQAAVGDAGTGALPPPLYAPPSRPTDAPE